MYYPCHRILLQLPQFSTLMNLYFVHVINITFISDGVIYLLTCLLGCMICGFPKFPRIRSRFCLLILYSNIRLTVLYQFGIWCCWMFSYGSRIWACMLFCKRDNKFLFLDILCLLWYLLGIVHYWLDIFHWLGVGVFLYSCMFFKYYLLGDWLCVLIMLFMLGMQL